MRYRRWSYKPGVSIRPIGKGFSAKKGCISVQVMDVSIEDLKGDKNKKRRATRTEDPEDG